MARASTAFAKAIELVEKQKSLIETQQAKIASLGEEFTGMRRFTTKQTERLEKSERAQEALQYKLQLTSDQLSQKMDNEDARAVAHAKVCAANTELRAELKVAKEYVDPYYQARFRNEVVKTQELGQKVWELDEELVSLRTEYDDLVKRYEKDAELWRAGFRLSGKISKLSDKFASEDFASLEALVGTGLHDLNVRVGKLEAEHAWDEDDDAWDFHTLGGE